jgi:hypothetical protein
MAAQRVEQIARIMACGVEDLFSIVHELILKSGHKKDVVRLNNQWVEVDPAQWRKRTDFRISVGYAAGNKDALMARLSMIAQMQEKAAAGGLPIVTPQNIYETAIEMTKASDFSAPQRFWTNPQDAPPPPPPQPDVTVMAAEQIKSQTALQTKQLDVEQKERDSERDFAIKKYQIDADVQMKAGLALHQAETEKEKLALTGEQTAQLETHRTQLGMHAESKKIEDRGRIESKIMELDQAKEQLVGQAQQIVNAMQQLMQQLKSVSSLTTGKRRVVKGKNGKAEAIEILGEDDSPIHRMNIVRGANGSIEGTA